MVKRRVALLAFILLSAVVAVVPVACSMTGTASLLVWAISPVASTVSTASQV